MPAIWGTKVGGAAVDDAGLESNGNADIGVGSQTEVVKHSYFSNWSTRTFYRSVLFQIVLFGASNILTVLGPAMSDAITNLGGGGLSTPYLANLATALNYAMGCATTLFGGPLINKFGIKWSCMIAAVVMPLTGSAYYVSARYSVDAYLLASQDDRGFYLGIWSAIRNSGSVIGGAINFSTNYKDSSAGGIAWSTYLIFVGFEYSGVTWLVFFPAFYSFFYGGTMGAYLSLHFSVRARALSSLLVPSVVIPLVIAYGKLLDTKRWSRGRRAWISFLCWLVPQIACFIWIGIEYGKCGQRTVALDYKSDTRRWAEAYLPYLIIFVTGYWTQLCLYWCLGCLATDMQSSSRTGGLFRAFETAGQAVSYGINSASGNDKRIPFFVNCAVLALTMPCMVLLIRLVARSGEQEDGEGNALEEVEDVQVKVAKNAD
ncbi:hypothetical protein M409DRAFT_63263 [Zasmidium cellare ATCC 36951]|uniref:Uncharacterized protein n=1 Tax=Zasmidium cellare ATCC 36951 TaxID=1080233 RepID=A0A6A6CX70_ZASCE|nr:uncharacterized protein M409DRAFT_63263 [Zasmidium cellare ATCC 36951]KAF2171625.1 hypothetical protein M409DRAFT_63263 [Zasmidium cellare ATCC 36951]